MSTDVPGFQSFFTFFCIGLNVGQISSVLVFWTKVA